MVSTRASERYTPVAVESFFRNTELDPAERLILIDNDRSLNELPFAERIELIPNSSPLSFAENLNQTLVRAGGAEVYFLNNDLVFTPGWLKPLETIEDAIVTPLSNREVQYAKDTLRLERYLSLEDFQGKESLLDAIAEYHRARSQGYRSVFYLPFFCVKIPPKIYSRLDPLDEGFGKGGAEDNDYCLRAILAGFKVLYAMQSYLLHFSGKSTWHGAESPEETRTRDELYVKHFESKWGEKLRRLSINGDLSALFDRPDLLQAFQQGEFKRVIEALAIEA
jgi:hypothetical protein